MRTATPSINATFLLSKDIPRFLSSIKATAIPLKQQMPTIAQKRRILARILVPSMVSPFTVRLPAPIKLTLTEK